MSIIRDMVAAKVNSMFGSVCYRVGGVVMDPGDEWEGFDDVEAVLLSHAHFDHIYGLNVLARRSPSAVVYTNESGKEMLLSPRLNLSAYHEDAEPFSFDFPERIRIIEDREKVSVGNCVFTAIFTPGHNPSCVSWICNDKELFTGDSWIPGLKTVTNLPRGNKAQAIVSETLLRQLAADSHPLFPGHST